MSDKKILFVVMPWHSVHYGSLGVGVLTSIARRHPTADRICVDTLYASLRWAAYLSANTDGKLDSKAYAHLGEDLFFQAVGDWIFAPAFHQSPEWGVSAFKQQFRGAAGDFEMAVKAHRLSRPFVEKLAAEIVAASPDVIGLTSVFQQNMACLALARRVKELAPHITIIMGGANCDGPQGPALHRIYPFLDIVFSGESDLSFPVYLDYLDGTQLLRDVPGITWRDAEGQSVTNRRVQLPKGNELVAPDHDDYFNQAMSSPIAAEIEPNIVAESARGCWWGQKHHCTFCGLNGMGMTFRSKPADVFVEELERLVVRHQSLDVILADNILDMDYLRSVVPAIAAKGWDLRLHYEIKANLSYEQLEALREAGIVHIQPGIESLSTRVLKLMQKGISGPQNVRVLRDCEELNLTTTWNILGGFPGEEEADYRPVIEQMAALVHLPPPSGTARLSLERFSPFFDKPSMGFGARRPAEHYRTIYNLPDADLMDILYIFESDPQGVTDTLLDEMERAVEGWKASYHAGGTLIMTDDGGTLTISDTRANWPRRDHRLHGFEAEIYRSLRRPLGENALIDIGSRFHGGDGERMALAALARFRESGLVFTDDAVSVALATRQIPFRLRLVA